MVRFIFFFFFSLLVLSPEVFAKLVTYCYVNRRIPRTAENIHTKSATRDARSGCCTTLYLFLFLIYSDVSVLLWRSDCCYNEKR